MRITKRKISASTSAHKRVNASLDEMLDVFKQRLDELDTATVTSASEVDDLPSYIKGRRPEESEDFEEIEDHMNPDEDVEDLSSSEYLEKLFNLVDTALSQDDSILNWDWSKSDDKKKIYLVVFSESGDSVEYTIPISDLTEDINDIDVDVSYIMKAINRTEEHPARKFDADFDDDDEFGVIDDLDEVESSTWLDVDDVDDDRYELIQRKDIRDFDGFMTEYCLYFDNVDKLYFTVFGDSDLYSPADADHDFETENEMEALEWFENYSTDEDDDIYSSSVMPEGDAVDIAELDPVYTNNNDERIQEIAEKYTTSVPVSGDWDTELVSEMHEIMDLGYTRDEAIDIMVGTLGFDPEEFKNVEASSDVNTIDGDYTQELASEVEARINQDHFYQDANVRGDETGLYVEVTYSHSLKTQKFAMSISNMTGALDKDAETMMKRIESFINLGLDYGHPVSTQ